MMIIFEFRFTKFKALRMMAFCVGAHPVGDGVHERYKQHLAIFQHPIAHRVGSYTKDI